jgi:tetratricopeptide (TPR) repeat protein
MPHGRGGNVDGKGSQRRRRLSPEDHLQRALGAKTPRARGNWALKGLATPSSLDRTTHAMLLRQLYLARYAQGDFDGAYDVATQATELGVLSDVMHQDAARAAQAVGNTDDAVGHLRLAARHGPASRRAFHWWTLGSVLFLAGRHDEAIDALERAARWGTTDKPLYRGHLALAKCHAGRRVRGLPNLMAQLAECPAGQGYGRFVLGQLAFESERFKEARRYLEAFVKRTSTGRRATKLALAGELAMARRTLEALETAG